MAFNPTQTQNKGKGMGWISAGASVIGGLGNAWAQDKANSQNQKLANQANDDRWAQMKYQNDYNREMTRKANKHARKQWEASNLYNSPAEQMKRYQEAGINPNLIYGSGSASAGNSNVQKTAPYQSSAPANIERATVNPLPIPDLSGAVGTYQDTRIKRQQSDNLAAQQSNTDANTLLTLGKVDINKHQETVAQVEANVSQRTKDAQIEQAQLQSTKTKSQINQINQQTVASQQGVKASQQSVKASEQNVQQSKSKHKLDMEKLRAGLKSTEMRNQMDAFELELQTKLKEFGLLTKDATYYRIAAKLWSEKLSPTIKNISKYFINPSDYTNYRTHPKNTERNRSKYPTQPIQSKKWWQ